MIRILFALLLLLAPFASAQTGGPPVVLDTIADALARRARTNEVISIRNYSAVIPWSEPRTFTALTNVVSHDGVHYLTNRTAGLVYHSSDRISSIQRPEWYGAAVDDSTDDSAAINAALTRGPAVLLSAGVYNIGGSLQGDTAIRLLSNRTLRGVPGTKIVMARGDGTYSSRGVYMLSVTNVVVGDFEIYASPGVTDIAQSTYGVMAISGPGGPSRDILIENVIAHDLTAGIDSAGSGTHPVYNSTVSRCIAYDCVNNGAQAVYADGLKVVDCEFYSNGGTGGAGYGFDLETNDGEYTSNVIFERNLLHGNLSGGLAAVAGMGPGGTNIVFKDNTLWDNPLGINVNGQSTNRYNGITLTGNKFRGNSTRGFSVSRANRVKIVGNTSDGDDSNSVLESSFVDIDGNTFRNSTNECLEISSASTSQGVNIRGNTMLNAGTRGINAASISQSLIEGNVIQTPGRDGIVVTGSDSVIANNLILGAGRSAEGTYVGLSVGGTRNTVSGNFVRKFFAFDYGYAQAGSSNSITLAANAVGTDTYHTNAWVSIVQGTGAGQIRQVTNFVESTKVALVSTNWTTNPTNDSVYQIGQHETTTVTGTATAVSSTSATLDTWASATSQRYTGGFIKVTAGTGSGQERLITAYSTGREATINTAWSVTPDTNSTLVVIAPKGTWRGVVVVGDSQVAENNSFSHAGMSTDFLDAGSGTALTPKFLLGTAAPTFGTYRAGDITWNSDPDAGEPISWACSVSGDPGTWIASPAFGSGGGGSLPSGSSGDLLVHNGADWVVLTVGTNGTYLGGSSSYPTYLPLNTDQVIIDGQSEALNEMLYIDSASDNIYLRPHQGGGLSIDVYIQAFRGIPSARFTRYNQRLYSDSTEVARVAGTGIRIQPAGVSADPSYALDVVGTTSLAGSVIVTGTNAVTIGGETRTNWPPSGTTLPTATLGSLLYGNGTSWTGLGIGSSGYYLNVSGGIPSWGELNTDKVIIDGHTEALNELLLVDGSDNIYLRPHQGGGLSTSIYLEAFRGKPAMRLTETVQRMYADTTELFRLSSGGIRIQPAGVSASASYALDVVGTANIDGNLTVNTTNIITELAGKQPLDADLTAVAAGTAIPTAQTNAVSWSAPLMYVGTTNIAYALSQKQPYDTRLQEIANITWNLGDLLYYNGSSLTDRAIGSEGQVLKVVSGIPSWAAESGGGGTAVLVNSTNVSNPNFRRFFGITDSTNVDLLLSAGANITFTTNSGVLEISGASGSGDIRTTTAASADYNATDSDSVIRVNAVTEDVTITLPASPSDGRFYTVMKTSGIWDVIVDDGSTTYTMDTAGQSVTLVYMTGYGYFSFGIQDGIASLSSLEVNGTAGVTNLVNSATATWTKTNGTAAVNIATVSTSGAGLAPQITAPDSVLQTDSVTNLSWGSRWMPVVTISGTNHTLVLTNAGQYLRLTSASVCALTVPAGTNVAYTLGTEIVVRVAAAGIPTLTGESGVTLNGTNVMSGLSQHSTFGLKLVESTSTNWVWDIL